MMPYGSVWALVHAHRETEGTALSRDSIRPQAELHGTMVVALVRTTVAHEGE